MTRFSIVLVAAALAVSGPAFAGGLSTTPFMPTLTYPSSDASPVTKANTVLLETCTTATHCAKAVEDISPKRKAKRGE